MEDLKAEIESIETGKKIEEYIEKTKDLIQKYKKLSSKIKTILFDEEKEDNKLIDAKGKEKLIIIDKYLEIAKKYIQIDVIRVYKNVEEVCYNCGEKINITPLRDFLMQTCTRCNAEYDALILYRISKDEQTNLYIDTDDDSIENFLQSL